MKKIAPLLFTLSFALVAGLTFSFVFENVSGFSNALDGVREISSREELIELATSVNDGSYEAQDGRDILLKADIDLTSAWTPIGNESHPFKWKFDGNGFRINGLSLEFNGESGSYQGFFGMTDGATIQNLQINGFQAAEWPNSTDVYIGALVGGATNHTQILRCEIVNADKIEQDSVFSVSRKETIGGMVGWLKDSTVSNSAVYYDLSVRHALLNKYTIKVGGVVGTCEGSEIKNVVSFSDIDIASADTSKAEGIFYVGGIVGELMTNRTIQDCVSAGRISYDNSLSSPQAGKVVGRVGTEVIAASSIAYVVGEREQVTKAYGSEIEEKNYVMSVPENLVRIKTFYDEDYYPFDNGSKLFRWSLSGESWNFDNIWIVVTQTSEQESASELRLQQFQNFVVMLADPIDSQHILEKVEAGAEPEDNRYPYNQRATFKFKFANSNDEKFYNISSINYGQNQLSYEDFNDIEGGKISPDGDISLTYADGVYTLSIVVSNFRSGTYFITLVPVEYNVYIKANDIALDEGDDDDGTTHGYVRFRGEQDRFEEKTRQIHKTVKIYPEAVEKREYTFSHWTLYYLDDEGDYIYKEKRWKKNADFELEGTNNKENPFTLEFGDEKGFFDRDILLVANFKHDTVAINFSFDYELIDRVEVIYKDDNNTDVTKVITATNSGVRLDKSESIRLKIYVNKTAEVTADEIAESIEKWFARTTSKVTKAAPTTDPDDSSLIIYEFSFSTSAINYQTEEGDPVNEFTLSIKAKKAEVKKQDNTVWIIVGVVGGVVLLAVIGIVIWLVIRRRYSGGGGKKDDYKKMYL